MSLLWIFSVVLATVFLILRTFLQESLNQEVTVAWALFLVGMLLWIVLKERGDVPGIESLKKVERTFTFWISLEWDVLGFSCWVLSVFFVSLLYGPAPNFFFGAVQVILTLGGFILVIFYAFQGLDIVLRYFGIKRWKWGS